MDEYIGIIIITVIICYLIAEIFGRSKHIGRWWTFFLLLSGLLPGIIAVITSPSAKKKPTLGGKSYVIWGWICLVLGVGNTITLIGSEGKTGQLFFVFFILAYYLFELSKGKIINSEHKYYFDRFESSKITSPSWADFKTFEPLVNTSINIEQIKSTLSDLKKRGVLSDLEYSSKLKKIEDDEAHNMILQTDDYLKLKQLYDAAVLDKVEFEDKVEKLKNLILNKQKKCSNSYLEVKDDLDELIENLKN
jgi:hypothetical protein